MNGENRDEAYEERDQAEGEEEESARRRDRTTHLRLQSFSEKCEASAITVDHIPPFTSPPLLRRAHVNHSALGCPPGETFGLRTSRVKNLSALKLIRQRALARKFRGVRMSLIEKKILKSRYALRAAPVSPAVISFPPWKMRLEKPLAEEISMRIRDPLGTSRGEGGRGCCPYTFNGFHGTGLIALAKSDESDRGERTEMRIGITPRAVASFLLSRPFE